VSEGGEASSGQASTLIALAAISAVTTIIGGYFAYLAATHSKQANDAVNHRHLHGVDENGEPTTPKLFDLALDTNRLATETRTRVEALDQWKDRWDGLPEELGDSHGLEKKLAGIDAAIVTTRQTLGERIDRLDATNADQHHQLVGMVEEQNAKLTERDDTAVAAITGLTEKVTEHIEWANTDLVPRFDTLAAEVERHVQWEEHVKYPEVVAKTEAVKREPTGGQG
jgi:hypothetical protein